MHTPFFSSLCWRVYNNKINIGHHTCNATCSAADTVATSATMASNGDTWLLSVAAAFVVFASALQSWEPPQPPEPLPPPLVSKLDYYLHSPAEAAFDCRMVLSAMTRWRALPAGLSAAYLVALHVARGRIKSIQLPRLRMAWNAGLSLFSFVVLSRVLPALLWRVAYVGLLNTACEAPEDNLGNGASGLWMWLFLVAKVAELGDTAFLVLGRRPLTLLHVWHHASALVWTWQLYVSRAGPALVFMAMNAAVHFLMYGYFAAGICALLMSDLPAALHLAFRSGPHHACTPWMHTVHSHHAHHACTPSLCTFIPQWTCGLRMLFAQSRCASLPRKWRRWLQGYSSQSPPPHAAHPALSRP